MRTCSTGIQGVGSTIVAVICLLLAANCASAQGRAASSGSSSHESERAAQVRALNNSVLELHGQMQENASGAGAAGLRGQAATVLAQRAAALSTLIQDNPRQALSFAFSPELLADLAAKFPHSASLLESQTTVIGPVQHWIIDNVDKTSRSLFRMKVGQHTLNLYFASQEPPNLKPGEALRAIGVVVGSDMAVSTSSTVQQSAASMTTSTISSAALHIGNEFVREHRGPISVLLLCALVLILLGLVLNIARASGHMLKSFKQFAMYPLAFAVIVSSPTMGYAQASSCSTTGVQNVVVLLVAFPGVTPPSYLTPQSVYTAFFGTANRSLDGYWRETSYGQTSAAGSVYGWYTLSTSYNCSNFDALRDEAITLASNAGVNFQNVQRLFIVTPDFGCGWAGLAGVGCSTLNAPTGSFTASTSYINGTNWMNSTDDALKMAAHEGGHNLGLNHSNSRSFGTEALGPLGAAGTETEYGDGYSAMTNGDLGHYTAPHKAEELKWLSPANYLVVQSGGTYTLQPFEANTGGLQVLKIQRGTGNNAWLWIEYRQPIGNYDISYYRPNDPWDPWANQVFAGALIHYEDSLTTSFHSDLLDFTPTSVYAFLDPVLAAGKTWTDPYSNLSLSVLSATTSGLTVSVSYGATPCTPSAPSVTVSPLNPSIYPGQSASYSASVTNNDSSACSSSTISLGSTEPAGWSTSLTASLLTLSPGKSGNVTLGKGAPNGTPTGTYAVNMTASNTISSGTATANATVVTPPSVSVSVSVSSTTYNRKATVPITVTVLSGGAPASGASAAFTLTTSTGGKITQTVTTGSSGTATWSYRLGPKSPTGTYSVSAQVNSISAGAASTQSTSSNTVMFTVQ